MTIDVKWLDTHKWGIRSSNDGVSYGSFAWAPLGEWTEPFVWDPFPACGGGLHVETPKYHGFRMLYSRPELIEYKGDCVGLTDKAKGGRARIVAVGTDVPDAAFERCGYRVAHDGMIISPLPHERWTVLAGVVSINHQSGGECRAYGDATLNVNASQHDGECYAYGDAMLNVNVSQLGGICSAYNNAVLNVHAQQRGGECGAFGHATLNVNASQLDGECSAFGRATLNVNASQLDGVCSVYSNAEMNVHASQLGGECHVYDNAVLRIYAPRQGGECWVHSLAIVRRHVDP